MNVNKKLILVVCFLFIAVSTMATLGFAEYPEKPITFAIDGSPGGGSDIWSRAFLQVAGKYAGVSFVGLNKPGGSSAVAMAYTLKKKADGYTICTVTPNFIVTPLRKDLGFNYKNFVPIATCLVEGKVIFTQTGKYNSLKEAIEWARENPGKQKWAIYGTGTDEHIIMYLITKQAGVNAVHVPHGGSGEAVLSVVQGVSEVGIAKPSIIMGHLEAGTIIPLATSTEERLIFLPEVPTLKELGYDIVIPTWRGLVAPAGTPPERVEFLAEVCRKTLEDPEFEKIQQHLKYNKFFKTGKELNELFNSQYTFFKEILEELGFETY